MMMNRLMRLGEGEVLLSLLMEFSSVAAARIGREGTLLEANAAFHALTGGPAHGVTVSTFFIRPGFHELIAAAEGRSGRAHDGVLHIGRENGQSRALRGVVYGVEDGIVVLAEMAEMADLTASITRLRTELTGKEETIARLQEEIDDQKRALQALMINDSLTGLPNRHKLEQSLDVEVERARRYRTPFSLVMSDIDNVDELNQIYGREAGDRVLKRFGQILASSVRRADLAARYEGGTFLTLLPHSNLSGGTAFAERLRARFSTDLIPSVERPVTASFGVTEYLDQDSSNTLLDRAGAALLQAKNSGRNRVSVTI